jgi:phage-related minor tail protein
MAQNGQLTTDKIVPLLTNVELLRKEFETLPASISGSAQKVQNSFMAWVGGANDALGASTALAGALDGLASNLDTVASGAAVLAAVGGSRLLGGILSGVTSSAGKVLDARKNRLLWLMRRLTPQHRHNVKHWRTPVPQRLPITLPSPRRM